MSLTNIKTQLKTILEKITQFKKVYEYEPGKEGIPSNLPACTISTLGISEFVPSEIDSLDRVYNVAVKVYLKLIGAKNVQQDIDSFIELVINKLQANSSLGGSCDYFRITSVAVDYLRDRKNPVSVINFYLDITEEVSI